MNILGLGFGYLATAALMCDGEIVAAVSEERFTHRKNEEGYPRQAIDDCLRQAGIASSEIDLVVIGGNSIAPYPWLTRNYSSFSIDDHIRAQREYWYPRLIEGRDVNWMDVFADKADYDQYPGGWKETMQGNADHHGVSDWERFRPYLYKGIFDHLGIDKSKIEHAEHHSCHASYAYWGSPFRNEPCLVITADAYGDGLSATVSVVKDGVMERVKAIPHTDFKLGRMYRYITLVLGMKPAEHEYKVMGLAPYCKEPILKAAYEAFRETMYVDGLDFKWKMEPKDLYHHFRNRLEGYRFDGIAGALQKYTEEILMEWIGNAIRETGIKKVTYSGGVSMNVKANMLIHAMDDVEDLFVCPSGGDESLPIGACYQAMAMHVNDKGLDPNLIQPIQPYLGREYSSKEICDWVAEHNLEEKYHVVYNANHKKVAGIIADGQVVGRMVGRMEFGARSLGNRAIIADPRNIKTVDKINRKIKNRDFWMPFAPTILAEHMHEYVLNPKNIRAPFMTIGFESTSIGQELLPAGLHPSDKTMRPQILEREANPRYHALLSAFRDLTGVGGVLNTSFNLHGLPIVLGPDEALHVFENSDIDAILLEDVLILKEAT